MNNIEIVKLDIDELPAYNSALLYDITSLVTNQLYQFFKRHEPGKYYLFDTVPSGHSLAEYVKTDFIKFYNDYGIYFEDGVFKPIKYHIVIIPSEVYRSGDCSFIEQYVNEYRTRYNLDDIQEGDCIVELTSKEQKYFIQKNISEDVDSTIMQFYDRYKVANNDIFQYKNEDDFSSLQRQFPGKKLVNFAPYLLKYNCLAQREKSVTLGAYKKLLTYLVDTFDTDCIFYYSSTDKDISVRDRADLLDRNRYSERVVYVNFAAYLALQYGFKFIIADTYETLYISALRMFTQLKYRYVCNYLNWLKTPPLLCVSMQNGGYPFLFKRKQSKQDICNVALVSSELEKTEEGLRLVGDTASKYTGDANSINIISWTDFYNLHTLDYETGRLESARLQKLLDQFQRILLKTEQLQKSISLDCSNTFLYSVNGKYYIAFLVKIDLSYCYTTVPLVKGYKVASLCRVSRERLHSLLDIRAFADYDVLVKDEAIKNLGRLDNTAEGFLIQLCANSQTNLLGGSDLHYDTVAFWDSTCEMYRGVKLKHFTDKNNLPVLGLRKNFLTFFGGPHPYRGKGADSKPILNLNQAMWDNTDL